MEQALLAILPLALAASMNPTGLLVESTVIGASDYGRTKALRFVIGGTLFLVILGLLVMLFFNHAVLPSVHHERLSAWIDIVLGLLIAALVVRSFRSGARKKRKKVPFSGRRRPYLVIGFAFMAVNTSTNIPFIAASKIIAERRLPVAEAAILFILLVLITMALLAFPVVLSYAAPQQADRVAAWLDGFMGRYGTRLMQAFFLLVSLYLVGKGLNSLIS